MSTGNFAALLAALVMVVFPIGAWQDSSPASEAATTGSAGANQVVLDVVVLDKKGRKVKNLSASEVGVYEDGVRQEIQSFRLVTGSDLPVHSPTGASHFAVVPSQPLSISLPSVNLVCIVFHNLDPVSRRWAVAAAQEFLKTQLHPRAWVGIFNLDARLMSLYPFSNSRDDLLKAADKAFYGTNVDITRAAEAVLNSSPNIQFYVGTGSGMADLSTTGSVSGTAITGADVDNSPSANAQRGDLVLEREQFIGVEGARQMDQMKLMVRQLGAFPGHKTVLLFSSGFTTTGDPDQFQAMLNKANLGEVSVYAFDATGLGETSSAEASPMAMQHVSALSQQQGQMPVDAPGNMAERARQSDYQQNAVRTSDSESGLRALSEGTGGFLVANSNDLRKPFQQIGADVEAHYELVYHSSAGKLDGQFRKIEIKLARSDWRAESRQGYFAIPERGTAELRPFEIAGLMALNAQSRPHTFEFRSAAFQFRPGVDSQSEIVFELPGAALTATAVPAQKKHRLHASLFAVVKDRDGQIVDRFGRDDRYEVPDGQLAGVQATTIDYRHAFHLPGGHYTVESVLLDREARRASTSTVEFDSPVANGVGLSTPILVARADPLTAKPEPDDPLVFKDRELVPLLKGAVRASTHPMLYFVVYPETAQEMPRVRVAFLVNGKELAQKQEELPPPDASGAIPVMVSALATPGTCEVRITALQGSNSVMRSITYTVVP